MSGNKNKIIAFNYFGGKFTYLDNLYANFPQGFTHLVDLFAGSMCVSLNYRGRIIRTANEINADITNFFEVLRDHESELIRLLLLTPCSEQEYNNCWELSPNKIERARRFYVRARQSFFGLGAQQKNKGWHCVKEPIRCETGEIVSRWNNALEKLHIVAEIIRSRFQIINLDYAAAIDKLDFPRAFFYCDPPYPNQCRASHNDYKYEFSDQMHSELATRLHSIEGYAMVSGYDCEILNDLYHDWRKVIFPGKKNNIRSRAVQEVIWMNYDHVDKPTLF